MATTMREPLVKRPPTTRRQVPDDGTAQLLRAGLWILLVGALAALFAATLGGGIGEHGPHTNSGWLALILALMSLPFGLMLTALGGAKWLRNRRLARLDH
jgi:hypothetical protein